ncbi:MAG: ketosteroid isomerase-like protein [Candidatus Endobugula sp.]|jgi:ketosteroid isomerase-like protein
MTKLKNSTMAMAFILLVGSFIIGCTETESKKDPSTNEANSTYEIAPNEYADLSEKAIKNMADLDFDKWGEMMADDVEYYFPDGDAGTRTKLTGKSEVVGWFKNWKETSGIEKMTSTNSVHVPVIAKESLNYTGLSGVLVLSYFSNEMVYDGTPVSVRMHYAAHFNDDKLIDKYYTYYDRTPIVNTVNANILKAEVDEVDEEN